MAQGLLSTAQKICIAKIYGELGNNHYTFFKTLEAEIVTQLSGELHCNYTLLSKSAIRPLTERVTSHIISGIFDASHGKHGFFVWSDLRACNLKRREKSHAAQHMRSADRLRKRLETALHEWHDSSHGEKSSKTAWRIARVENAIYSWRAALYTLPEIGQIVAAAESVSRSPMFYKLFR